MDEHKPKAMLWQGDLVKGLKYFQQKYALVPTVVFARPEHPVLEGKKWTKKEYINGEETYTCRIRRDELGPANLLVICATSSDW